MCIAATPYTPKLSKSEQNGQNGNQLPNLRSCFENHRPAKSSVKTLTIGPKVASGTKHSLAGDTAGSKLLSRNHPI